MVILLVLNAIKNAYMNVYYPINNITSRKQRNRFFITTLNPYFAIARNFARTTKFFEAITIQWRNLILPTNYPVVLQCGIV